MPEEFFTNLKEVAGSPYSFIAYIFLIAGWAFISFRNSRLKHISQAIKDLPETDRRDVLIQEYGIYLKEGMSAQDYLKGQRQTYVFYLIIAIIIMITVVTAIAYQKPNEVVEIDSEKKINPELCNDIDNVLNNIEGGFSKIAGNKENNSTNYSSKFRINGTKRNSILCSKSDTMYFAAIYTGGDKTIAYKQYNLFTNEIRKCKDDWIIVPANTDEIDEGMLEYTSFVQGNQKITVTFNLDEDSSYDATLLILSNKKNQE